MNLITKKTVLMFIFMIATTFTAQEINDIRYQNIINQLNLKNSQIKEDLVVEKKMPNSDNSFIAVIPVLAGQVVNDGFTVQNTILITDENGRIKNKFFDINEYY